MKKSTLFLLFFTISWGCISQEQLKGMVMVKTTEDSTKGLAGASVYWMGTSLGGTTNAEGWFEIPSSSKTNKLVISYIGYQTDTLQIVGTQELHHRLKELGTLEEVVVRAKKKATAVAFLGATNSLVMHEQELLKAACCNLSESFETNPSIDVNFSDALTGTKQIQMLGLNSPYLLVTQENIPSIRGASQAYGMSFIPGTWIQSIQVTKGVGCVTNGFESISGQINTELKKPRTDDKFFLNFYTSGTGRREVNTHLTKKLSKTWNLGLYLHGNKRSAKIDRNQDLFLDLPLSEQVTLMNRWQYTNPASGWISFIDLKYLKDAKQMGAVNFNPKSDRFTTDAYGSENDTERFETAAKLGYIFKEKPYQSFGVQTAFSRHQQDSYYGFNVYDIVHKSGYVNTVFQSILGNTQHQFKTGVNFNYDDYVEKVKTYNNNPTDYKRTERSVGAFFEYTYDNLEAVTLVAGLRIDAHNLLGVFATPRLHVRYEPWKNGVFKASVGSGRRAASIFAENQQVFASSRSMQLEATGGKIYGLDPEKAWNYGLSYLHRFLLRERTGTLAFDLYRTDFQNQVLADYDHSPQEVRVYNSSENSRAVSLQVELNFELIAGMEFRTAYKHFDVEQPFKGGSIQKALQAQDRFFANMSYKTTASKRASLWKWDATYNWLGSQRIPSTASNPESYKMPNKSKPYALVSAQVTHVFSPKLELYVGGENLTNKTQKNPILGVADPFGPYFDTTLVYAPIVGSMFYGGLRYKI